MNERIEEILKKSGLKKVEFANKINVHQSYVTRLVSGEKTPSERLIDDICEKIIIGGRRIRKEWLLTGSGYMLESLTRNQEIGAFANKVMGLPDEDFTKRFVEALTRLDEKDWEAIERIVDKISEKDKKEGG